MKPVFRVSKNDVTKSGTVYNVLQDVTSLMKNDDISYIRLPSHFIDIDIQVFEYATQLFPSFGPKCQELNVSWMISWSTRRRSFALAKELSEQGAIPVESVAVPVSRKGEEVTCFH